MYRRRINGKSRLKQMRHRKLFSTLLLGGLILCTVCINAETRLRPERPQQKRAKTTRSDNVEYNMCYDFSVPGETSKIKFTCILPSTLPRRQKIFNFKYSSKPSMVFKENGKHYAEFVFPKPEKQFKLEIKFKAELLRYDLQTARKMHKPKSPGKRNLADFLKDEIRIEADSEAIRRVIKNIDGDNQIEIVKQIHDFVAGHLKYVYSKKSKGALYAIEHERGDCDEFTSLFVALCRARKIPARWVTGYTTNWNNTPKHSWAEVFLKKYGWVPFDPTRNRHSERDFASLKPIYIYTSNSRNDPILHGNRHCYYRYWGAKPKVERSFSMK